MPSLIYRVQNHTGDLEHSFGGYSIKLSENHCTINFNEKEDISSKSFNPLLVDPYVPNIMAKLSIALDIPYSPDNIRIDRNDQENITNYSTGSRYRCSFSPIQSPKKGIDLRPKINPEEHAKEYDLTPPKKRHALAKALLDASPIYPISILACDRWTYGKYLEEMAMQDEAFLKYYKSMELLNVPPDKSNPRVDPSIEDFCKKSRSWIVRYRANWFAHNNPHSPQFDKKNLDYTQLLEAVLKKPYSPTSPFYWDAIIEEYEDAKEGNMENLHYNREFCRHLARYEIMSAGFGLKCQIIPISKGYDFDVILLWAGMGAVSADWG